MIVGLARRRAASRARRRPPTARSPRTARPTRRPVDTFIAMHADNTASIKTGRVELGQGSNTGLLMIAAEELDMDIEPAHVRHGTTPTSRRTPASRRRAARSRAPARGVRSAAATAKQALLGMAATQLGVPVASLSVSKGVVSGGGKTVTYGAADRRQAVQRPMAAASINPGQAPSKAISSYKLVGEAHVPRVDIPDKVTGTARLRAEHPHPRDAARPARPAARPGRVRRRHDAEDRLGRRELDQAHPGRAGRPAEQLPRRRRRRRSTTRSRRRRSSR